MADVFPWWIKWGFIGGSGLMSATIGIFKPDYLAIGFIVGAFLVVSAILGAGVHLIRARRKTNMGPIYLIGLGALLILGGVGWEIFNSLQLPNPATPTNVQTDNRPPMTIDGLDSLGGPPAAAEQPKPDKIYTKEDRARILEALYKANEVNSKEFGKIINDTRKIYLDWFNRDNSISATKALETQRLIAENDKQMSAASDKLYRELRTDYDMYWDVIWPAIDETWDRSTRRPLDELRTSLQKMSYDLHVFITILEKHSISSPSPEVIMLPQRASEVVNAQTSMFEDWRLRNSQRIKEATDKFRAAQ